MKTVIYKNNFGKRIDKFLKKEVFLNMDITRGEIIRNIKAGRIFINGKNAKPSHILKEGDKIEIDFKEKEIGITANKNIKFKIIYQDENIAVIDKPAGLQTHPSAKGEKDTLANGLLYKFPGIKNVGDAPKIRPGIVHRLDKDTSGIMIVAKNQKTFLALKNKFKNKEIAKIYWAVICGRLKNKKGVINSPIARSANYKKQVIAGKRTKTVARSASTHYKIVESLDDFSLLEIAPKTGRMHQIRVHMASIGHPVAGDKKYKLKNIKEAKGIERQLLHAKSIDFELNGNKYSFEAELPADFQNFLDEKGIKY
jgi:23S rRNA pseudouridine1911/1915/1917 synthase